MIALEFITGHVIYNPAYTYKFQLKTTHAWPWDLYTMTLGPPTKKRGGFASQKTLTLTGLLATG